MPRKAALTCLAVVLAGSLAVSGCSSSTSGSGAGSSASASTGSSTTSTTAPAKAAAPESSGSAVPASSTPAASGPTPAAGVPVAVNKNFAEPNIGESGTVLKYVRNFPVSAASKTKYSTLNDVEVVLVEVTVHSSTKYYDTLGSDSFFLLGNDGERISENDTVVTADMTAAGYPILKDAENGASSTGWMAVLVDRGFTQLTLQYYTLAATTSDGSTIPAKKINIRLV